MRPWRLRGKLAFSYALVTVLVVLTLGLLLAAAAALWLRSGAALQATAESLRTEGAPRLAPLVERADPTALRQELLLYAAGVDPDQERRRAEDGTGLLAARTGPPTGTLTVLAPDRTVLATTPEPAAPLPVDAEPMVTAALSGTGDPASLTRRAGDRHLVAVPLAAGGRVVGVLVGVFPLPALTPAVLGTVAGAALAVAAPVATLGLLFGLLTAYALTRRLNRLIAVSQSWGGGDLAARVDDRSGDELGQLARRLDGMAGDLAALVRDRQEVAGATARRAMARDLHDSVRQLVYAASLQVDAARDAGPDDHDRHLARATGMLRDAQHELDHLMTPALPTGLATALGEHVRVWSERSGIPAEVEVAPGAGDLRPEAGQALFRVAQEALANVAKHSGATAVRVTLDETGDGVRLTVTDDGRGLDPAAVSPGFLGRGRGLPGMRERMAALGGRAEVAPADGGGTRVTAWCPS